MPVTIPQNYWEGIENLEKECPWFTPGATIYLDAYLRPSFKVLELGSGGSTVFFAKRCSQVISIESSEEWRNKVIDHLKHNHINNVESLLLSLNGLKQYLKTLPNNYFDVILIDPIYSKERAMLTKLCNSKLKAGGFLIIDNYANTQRKIICLGNKIKLNGWFSYYFDDPHWDGKGTSINIKPYPDQCSIKFKVLSLLRMLLVFLKNILKIFFPQIEKSRLYLIISSKFRFYNPYFSLSPYGENKNKTP